MTRDEHHCCTCAGAECVTCDIEPVRVREVNGEEYHVRRESSAPRTATCRGEAVGVQRWATLDGHYEGRRRQTVRRRPLHPLRLTNARSERSSLLRADRRASAGSA